MRAPRPNSEAASLHREDQPYTTSKDVTRRAEAKTFLKATRSHRLHTAFTCMLMLGLRRGEALGISWNDLDLDAGVLQLRHQIQRGPGGLVLQDLKTEESAVTLPVPGPLLDVLLERYEIQDYEKARPDWANWQDASLVTTTLDGAAIDPRNLNRAFVTETAKAGLRRIRVHDTRHTCASLLRSYGVDLAVIQRILRHTQLLTTADVYLHVNTDDQRAALNLIANALDHNPPSTDPDTQTRDTAAGECDQQGDQETGTVA